jgi:hypothetical protein
MVWPSLANARSLEIPSPGVIVSNPRPPIIPTLLAALDRALAAPIAPWRVYPQWQAQRQLLQRVRDILSLWPTTESAVESTILAPLQADIQQLVAQRQALQAEVTELTMQRSALQAQMMAPLIDQVEQLELFQQRTQQMLRDVDGTVQLTLRSVDQDLTAHQRGFTQRLGKLEDLSQQSETIVATLLSQLIQEVQQLRQLPPATGPMTNGQSETIGLSIATPLFPPTSPSATAPVAATPVAATPVAIGQLTDLLGQLGLREAAPVNPIAPTDVTEFTLSLLDDRFELDR